MVELPKKLFRALTSAGGVHHGMSSGVVYEPREFFDDFDFVVGKIKHQPAATRWELKVEAPCPNLDLSHSICRT